MATPHPSPVSKSLDDSPLSPNLWLYFDGSCWPKSPGGTAAYGFLVCDGPGGNIIASGKWIAARNGPAATNNTASWAGLHAGLVWLEGTGWAGHLRIFSNEKLVIEQVAGRWRCRADTLSAYLDRCQSILGRLGTHEAIWIPRRRNMQAKALAPMAAISL